MMKISLTESTNINPKTVHIWSATANSKPDRLSDFSKILSKDELLKASKFRFEKDRIVYITARVLLRKLIGNYLGIKPEKIVFEYTEFGKPIYLNNEELNFNVSHSGNQIIIGFTTGHLLGVDIEKIKKDFEPLELAKNVFSNNEIKALSKTKGAELYQAFYRGWTRKESFIKAIGEGLSYPLKSFTVTLDNNDKARFISIKNEKEAKQNWQLHSFVPAEGFIAAVTTKGEPDHIEFFDANSQLL